MKGILSLVGSEFDKNDLQVVILEAPKETLLVPDGKELFANVMELRIKGYTNIHTNAILPMDTSDFLATHLIVCTKKNPLENVLMSYKSTSFQLCKKFNLAFPFTTILEKSAHPNCINEMKNILEHCEKTGQDLSYDAGWTVNPQIRENKELQIALKEIVVSFLVHHHRDYNIPHWVTFGICKVKTDQLFLKMGATEISDQPMISHPYLLQADARALILENHQYTEYAMEISRKYQDLWESRITISGDRQQDQKKAA